MKILQFPIVWMMLTNDELSMPLELKPTKCVSPTSTLNVRGSVQYCMKLAFCTAKTKDSSGPHTGSRLPGPDGEKAFLVSEAARRESASTLTADLRRQRSSGGVPERQVPRLPRAVVGRSEDLSLVDVVARRGRGKKRRAPPYRVRAVPRQVDGLGGAQTVATLPIPCAGQRVALREERRCRLAGEHGAGLIE